MRMRLFERIHLLFVCILLVYTAYIGIKNLFRYNTFKIEHSLLQEEHVRVIKHNSEYKMALNSLENPRFWEALAKQKLGLRVKGERIYKIRQDQQ